jgi:hypothetical protein
LLPHESRPSLDTSPQFRSAPVQFTLLNSVYRGIDRRQVVPARGEVVRHRRQIAVGADLQHQIHPYHDVEQEVTVEEPETRIVRAESQHHVSVVGHCDRVLRRRQIELAMQQPLPVQVQGVLQVDLLDVLVGGPADTDHVERVPVQMERMAEIRLLHWKKPRLEPLTGRFMHLTFVDEHDFDDGVQGNVYFMGAHAVLLAALGSVVSVAELRRVYVVVLGDERRGRRHVRDLVDQTEHVVAVGGNWRRTGETWGRRTRRDLPKCLL